MIIGIGTRVEFGNQKRNYLIDTFDRSDNATSPSRANTGQSWFTVGSPVWGITSKRLKMISGTGNGRCLIDFKLSNVKLKTILLGDMTNQRVVFRYIDDNNEWFINGNTIAKRVNGAVTAVALMAVTPKSGDSISIVMRGSSISVYVNDTHQVSVNDSTFSSANIFGFFSASPLTDGYFGFFSLEMV